MTRYVARPRAWLEPSYSDQQMAPETRLSILVIDEHAARVTGLYDHHGNELVAVNDRVAGFVKGDRG